VADVLLLGDIIRAVRARQVTHQEVGVQMSPSHHKLRSLALLGFSVLALSTACGGADTSSKPTGTQASSSPPPSSQTSSSQVVTRAIQTQNQLHDLSASVQSDTTTQGRSFTTEGKVEWTANPERFYAKTTSSLTNRQTEMIVDTPSQTTYVNATGTWIKTPFGSAAPQTGGGAAQGSGFLPALKGDAFSGFRVVGKEAVDGKPTWHLSGPMPFTSGAQTGSTVANTTGTLDVWVGQSDYRLVKQVENLKSTDASGFSMKATVVVDSVDTGLSIPLPKAP
jgi:hypothetical protein